MIMGFGLKKFDVEGKTAKYHLPLTDCDYHLVVRPATEVNKEYFNKILKKSHRHLKNMKRRGIDPKVFEENRSTDRELYPLHVIVGWEDVVDENDVPVEFSLEECKNLVAEMPDWMFDDLREFAGDIENFIDLMDVEEKVKN
jgi:hypothetical protein